MSALARYFNAQGKRVLGYDRVISPLCKELQSEGIEIHAEDLGRDVESLGVSVDDTLVIVTPAVPQSHAEKTHFQEAGYVMLKRAELLGVLTSKMKGLTVAGTHGKTTTSTLLAHVLKGTTEKVSAFLGGISSNYNTNVLLEEKSDWVVIEADEFDRSFLHLQPFATIVTSTDADHLDIYKDKSDLENAFQDFVSLIDTNGFVVKHVEAHVDPNVEVLSYGLNAKADYSATNLRAENGWFIMDVVTPNEKWNNIELGLPGIHNAENALGVIAMLDHLGIAEEAIRKGLKTFKGVKRRFEYLIRRDDLVYIDDYAHHPTAIEQLIKSVRLMYPNRSITAVFQPHLFSRTRDFMEGFATSLSLADEVVLMPIYPARELPIEGVTSEALSTQISTTSKVLNQAQEVIDYLAGKELDVVLTIGAGDIDRIVEPLKNRLL